MRRPPRKLKGLGALACQGVDVARDLDRLQVVEAELVARARAEAAIGRMIRRGLDAAKAAPPRRVVHAVVVQLAEALLAEGERAPGAVDLEVVLHLAAGRDPVALDGAGGAVLEHDEGAAHVVDLHGAPAAPFIGTLGDHGHAMPHHLGDRPEQIFRRGECVAADIGQRAAARRLVAEVGRRLGVGHVVLAVEAAVTQDLAELPGRDHRLRDRHHRVAEVVEPDLRPDACGFRRFRHRARVLDRGCERLLAVDVLARGDGRQRHLLVQRIGRGDVDHVDLGVVDHGPPVGRPLAETERVGGAGRKLLRDVGDRVQDRRERQAQDPLRRRIAEDMGLAHVSGADQADAERRFLRRALHQ